MLSANFSMLEMTMNELSNIEILMSVMGSFGFGVFIFALFVLFILIPFSIYSAQKWAYRSYKELRRIRELLEIDTGYGLRNKTGKERGTAIRKDPTFDSETIDKE